jgi:hypothetical protein
VNWLNKWPLGPAGFFRKHANGPVDAGGFGPLVLVDIRAFHLPEVAHFAKKAGWEPPGPLLKLIETEGGDRTKSPIEAPGVDDQARRQQIPERSTNVSETAWRRFRQACEFEPDFFSRRGGISKAARRVAKNENAEFESVRRDLFRVRKAQREQVAQK